jgi:hypothetical protein
MVPGAEHRTQFLSPFIEPGIGRGNKSAVEQDLLRHALQRPLEDQAARCRLARPALLEFARNTVGCKAYHFGSRRCAFRIERVSALCPADRCLLDQIRRIFAQALHRCSHLPQNRPFQRAPPGYLRAIGDLNTASRTPSDITKASNSR